MPAYQLFDQLRSFTGEQGQLVAGGELRFFDAGTTTPKDVFGNPGLSVNNGDTVTLDSSGRPDVPVWGDGDYKVELYDADGVKQGEIADLQSPAPAVALLPDFENGKFLTNDGLQAFWDVIRQLPDPTGQSGKVLSTDGSGFVWITKPADGAPGADAGNVESTASMLRIGNYGIVIGTGTCAASGSETASKAVTFAAPFIAAPKVLIQISGITTASSAALAAHSVTNETTTGFTANFNIADRHFVAGVQITNAIPFHYIAIGQVAQ